MAVDDIRKKLAKGEVAEGEGRIEVGVEGSCKRFFLQLLDPMASLFDYLYGKHRRIASIQTRLTWF